MNTNSPNRLRRASRAEVLSRQSVQYCRRHAFGACVRSVPHALPFRYVYFRSALVTVAPQHTLQYSCCCRTKLEMRSRRCARSVRVRLDFAEERDAAVLLPLRYRQVLLVHTRTQVLSSTNCVYSELTPIEHCVSMQCDCDAHSKSVVALCVPLSQVLFG